MYACIYKKRFPFHTRTSQKATKLNEYLDSSLSLHTFATLFINMKYLHFIIILIIFLVANKIYTGQVLETNTQPEQTVCIYQQEDTATHKQQDCRFLSSALTHIYKEARIDFNTSFHAFRTQWLQNQQRFVESIAQHMKKCIINQASYKHQLAISQYILFNNSHFFSSGKPCSEYYIYAMRRILI